MEFWLTYNNSQESLQLPVPPPEFKIVKGNTINIVNINEFGEIALIGKGKLAAVEISTFFPKQKYSFCQYSGFPAPYECVAMFERWRLSAKPIRLIITDTDVNLPCCIENFAYGERDGTGDVYFTMSLKEYRFLQTQTTQQQWQLSSRPVERETPDSYEVKEGDTLWAIAKRFLGDGSLAYNLAIQNNIPDHSMIYPGQVIIL